MSIVNLKDFLIIRMELDILMLITTRKELLGIIILIMF